jgi:type II secretory pathway pseudopilin PulG
MNEQNMPQEQKSINIWVIVAVILITALVVGGVVYALQSSRLKSSEQSFQQQITLLQNQIDQLQQAQQNQQATQPQEDDTKESEVDTSDNKAPQIISATFDGNGVVIQGERLTDSYVAFSLLNNPHLKDFCRELVTPECVLQKSVATDNTIKFISNWIGGKDTYKIYVENPTTGKSNEVSFQIP